MYGTMKAVLAASLVLAGAGSAWASPFEWTFDTIPASGDIVGTTGETVGWGYAITNEDLTRWLVVSGIPSADPFQHGTPDASVFDFPILAPGTSLSVVYNVTIPVGLYQFTWDAGAPVGFVNSGTFLLRAEWWDDDPFSGGSFIQYADDRPAPYSVTATAIPEPASLTLLTIGAGSFMLGWRRRRFPR